MSHLKSRALLSLAIVAATSAAGRAAPAPSPAAGTAPVVELTHGGSELPAARQRAVEQAILTVADAAGVVVCRDGTSLSQPESTALDRVCATPGLPRLWWDAEIGTEKSGEVEVLDVLLEVAIGGPPAESPRSIATPHALLPAGAQGEERETALLDGVHRSLLAAEDLRAWLAGLKQRPELLRARPATATSAKPHRPPVSAGQLRAWDSELRQIADLLIDGHYLDGRDRAVRLLKEDPSADVAGRARELLAKAEAKLRRVGSSAPKTGEPGETSQIVIRPSHPPAEGTERRRWERGFDVRVAKDDRGLADGPEGRLLISEDGVAFTHKGGSRPDWSIPWSDLTAAHRAEGLWDVPYPLALVEKSGRIRHLVRVDPAGKPLPGGAILSALAEGRLASHKGYS